MKKCTNVCNNSMSPRAPPNDPNGSRTYQKWAHCVSRALRKACACLSREPTPSTACMVHAASQGLRLVNESQQTTLAPGYSIMKHKTIDLDSLEWSTEANTPSTDTSIQPHHQGTQNHRFGQLRMIY